jgi:hypothetical protein
LRKGASMPDRLDKFVHDENIRKFTKQIEAETDPVRLAMLRTLLQEEQARLQPVEPKKPQ